MTTPIAGATSPDFTTPALSSPVRYWVRVTNTAGSVDSNAAKIDISFTDDPLVARLSVVRAVHVVELRTRINAVRVAKGLAPQSWTDSSLTTESTLVRVQHIAELRTALTEAYVAASLTPPVYTVDPTLAAGLTTVKAAHIVQIRSALTAIE